MTAPLRRSPAAEPPLPPTPAAALAMPCGWNGAHADPDWVPPHTGTLHLAEETFVGMWGFQRPNMAHNSRPLREQFLRTYPNRAFPVVFTTDECTTYVGLCRYHADASRRAA